MMAPKYPQMVRFDVVGVGRSKSIVMVVAKAPQRFEIVCCCELKRDGEGRCKHLREYMPMLRPWYLARMTVVAA